VPSTADSARSSAGSHATHRSPRIVALIGNPNTGKTTLFNALTGYRRHVANYPGVTVDVARGPIRGTHQPIDLLDLPGTYSLAAASPDEAVVCDSACGRLNGVPPPDAILAILDASNLPRNLYLLSQLLELNRPLLIALNMCDIARSRGIAVDADRLSERLGVPVVPIVATHDASVAPLVAALERTLDSPPPTERVELPPPLIAECMQLSDALSPPLTPAEALRAILDRDGTAGQRFLSAGAAQRLADARQRLADAGIDHATEVRARYAWIARTLDGALTRPQRPVRTWTDRLDQVFTHKLFGALILLITVALVFQAIFSWAEPLMIAVDGLFAGLAAIVSTWLPPGALSSLIVDGVIAGVGGVLTFLPQIMILFAFIAILEDCGYIARAAFMADRLMRSIGLSGRSFIPLLSSFACAVPAIMGTRVITDRRERITTILLAPFMSCSARLPVYVLLIGAFVPDATYLGGWVSLRGLVMLGMYLVGVLVAIPLGWLIKNTVLAGPASLFVLELPSFKWPRPRAIWQRMYFAGRSFVVRAGTIILALNIIVWALGYFPRSAATEARIAQLAAAAGWDEQRTSAELSGAYLRDSFLGRLGHGIEPAIRPLGWDWRIGVAVIASFPAREVVVATLGTIYNLGDAADDEQQTRSLQNAMKIATWPDTGRPVFTLPVALSIMVFFALCAQCSSTLVVIAREAGHGSWAVASFVGMTTIAYFAAWATSALAAALTGAPGGELGGLIAQ
jgi:ferrous iron transport protein B